jgi:hypothetical protein
MVADGQPSPSLRSSQRQPSADGAAATTSRNGGNGSHLELPASGAGRVISVLITPPAPPRTATAGTNTGGHQHPAQQAAMLGSPTIGVQRHPPLPPPPPLQTQQQQQHPGKHDMMPVQNL